MNAYKTLAMLAMVTASALAAAQTTEPTRPNQQSGQAGRPCKADVQRLCAGVQPGEGRIRACMREHQQDLSSGCKAAISRPREGQPAGRHAPQS